MSEAKQIRGVLVVGEAAATLHDLTARLGGATWVHQIVLVIMVAVGAIVGWTWEGAPGAVLGVLTADLSYNHIGGRLMRAAYRRHWTDRGGALDLPMTLMIEDDALISELGGVRRIIAWSAVSELFKSKGYWIFIAQGDGIYAPSRLFETSEAEKAFIAAALSRMSEGAKNRSVGAVTYAAGA